MIGHTVNTYVHILTMSLHIYLITLRNILYINQQIS